MAYVPKGSIFRAAFYIGRTLNYLGVAAMPNFTNAGAPTNGTNGTLAGVAVPGSLLVDTTSKAHYINTNTAASPTWTLRSAGGFDAFPSAAALTSTGTTRTDALALTAQFNRIETAGAGTGVILPAAVVGVPVVVFNDGSNAIKVYGAGTNTVDGQAATTGVTLTNAKRAIFIPFGAGAYVSAQFGAASA